MDKDTRFLQPCVVCGGLNVVQLFGEDAVNNQAPSGSWCYEYLGSLLSKILLKSHMQRLGL